MAATKTTAGGGLPAYSVTNNFGGNSFTSGGVANTIYVFAGEDYCAIVTAGGDVRLTQQNVTDLLVPLTQYSTSGTIT